MIDQDGRAAVGAICAATMNEGIGLVLKIMRHLALGRSAKMTKPQH